MSNLEAFVRESNRIEGIMRDPLDREIQAHIKFLEAEYLSITSMEEFVAAVQPGAVLRSKVGLDVRVGNHFPPRGGANIRPALEHILLESCADNNSPYLVHLQYETLHPFTDGNGRSGRALWLRMMECRMLGERALRLGFLHNWYYQSLEDGGRK